VAVGHMYAALLFACLFILSSYLVTYQHRSSYLVTYQHRSSYLVRYQHRSSITLDISDPSKRTYSLLCHHVQTGPRSRQPPFQSESVVKRPNHYADRHCYLVLRLRTSRVSLHFPIIDFIAQCLSTNISVYYLE